MRVVNNAFFPADLILLKSRLARDLFQLLPLEELIECSELFLSTATQLADVT